MLEQTINKYHNRSIDSAQVIEELIELSKKIRDARLRGEKLGMSEDELAFYDALGSNDTATEVMGDENLRTIAKELVNTVRKTASVDWTVKKSAQAKMRVVVKRLLRKHGYPADEQNVVAELVVKQAELLCDKEMVAAY